MAKLKVENQRRQKVLTAYGKELVSHFFLAVVDQARSQGGCNCTPPLDARSWQAMNIIHFIVQSTHILIRTAMCMSACKSTGTGSNQGCNSRSGIRAMARPFLPKVHLEKGYTCTDKVVCIYPVWIIIYLIEVLKYPPQPYDHNVWCEGNNSWPQWFQKRS